MDDRKIGVPSDRDARSDEHSTVAAPSALEARFLTDQELAGLIRLANRENVLQCSIGTGGVMLRPVEENRWAFDALDRAVKAADDWKAAKAFIESTKAGA